MRGLVFVLFMLLIAPFASSLDIVIVNSENWQDVYSGMLYASLENIKGHYLIDQQDGLEKTQLIDTNFPDTLLIDSAEKPVLVGYASMLAQRGMIVEKMLSEKTDANLKLAKRSGKKSFILLDDSYGYNAISVAPYAIASGRYVLFVNKENLDEVENLLEDVDSPQVLIYGYILREAQEKLAKFRPEILNNQDRFLDNIAITERFLKEKPVGQLTFSNGEFLETSLFFGEFPTVFIGKVNTPDSVKQFIKRSGVRSGVLVGNSLVNVMRRIKEEFNMSIFIRFSQGKFNQVRQLDTFPVPINELQLSITNIYYDASSNKLIVTYKNPGTSFLYFRSSIGLFVRDELLRRIGDENANFLEGGEIKSVSYDLGDTEAVQEAITAKIDTLYGDSPYSQEFILSHVASVQAVEFRDDSSIRLVSLTYDEHFKAFFVEVENTGPIGTYVHIELQDVKVGDSQFTLTVSGSIFIQPGEVRPIKIPANMLKEDYDANKQILVSAQYGKERTLLIFDLKENLLLQIIEKENLMPYIYGLGILVIVLLWVVIFLFFTKTEKKNK